MYLLSVLVLGLTYAVIADDCPTYTAVDNFDISKFEGLWYSVAVAPSKNVQKYSQDNHPTCVSSSFESKPDHIENKINFKLNGTQVEKNEKLISSDSTKGEFHGKSTFSEDFADFTFKIVCLEYTKYGVINVIGRHETANCSETSFIMVRDRTQYEELVKNEELKKCIHDKLQLSIDQFKTVSANDC